MAPRKDYLSLPEPQLVLWYGNFATRLAVHRAVLGLTQAELDLVVADAAAVQFVIEGAETVRSYSQGWTKFKTALLNGSDDAPPALPVAPAMTLSPVPAVNILRRTRELVERIKNHPSYTAVMGADLRIVGSEISEQDEPKPDATAEGRPNFEVIIKWVKRRFDGVDVESQRGSETAWTLLAFDSVSPYVDTRPPQTAGQAESRRYRLRYRKNDEPVGVYSDILTATAGP